MVERLLKSEKSVMFAIAAFLIFWVVKPFYLLPSGTFQIGDLFLVISFGVVAYAEHFKISSLCSKEDKYLRVFLLFVIVINSIYGIYYQEVAFLKSILYFIFNYMVIIVFRKLTLEDMFLPLFEKCCKLNLWIQLAVFLLGGGAYYEPGRYMGTYNDPNQFGFAVITAYLILFSINQKTKTKYNWIYFLLSSFLVIKSASMGMLLLLITFVFINIIYITIFADKEKRKRRIKILLLVIIAVVALGVVLVFLNKNSFITNQVQVFINRVAKKFKEAGSNNIFEVIVYDRNLHAFVNHPISVLYGSGEGLMNRYGVTNLEIHCTWIALLFGYGIIPTVFLIKWIKTNLKSMPFRMAGVYIGLFVEASVLVNYRQPAFWILLILVSVLKHVDDI